MHDGCMISGMVDRATHQRDSDVRKLSAPCQQAPAYVLFVHLIFILGLMQLVYAFLVLIWFPRESS